MVEAPLFWDRTIGPVTAGSSLQPEGRGVEPLTASDPVARRSAVQHGIQIALHLEAAVLAVSLEEGLVPVDACEA